MAEKTPLRRTIDRLLPVTDDDIMNINIVHGRPLSDLLHVLPVSKPEIVDLSSVDSRLRPRVISDLPPLSHIARPLGLRIEIRFYEVSGVVIYYVDEPRVDRLALKVFAYLRQKLGEVGVERAHEVYKVATETFDALGIDPKSALADRSVKAAVYYAFRDITGYGPLEIPMEDGFVEEVSWFSHDEPVEVVDKRVSEVYPNVEFVHTNIMIDPTLDDNMKKFVMTQSVRLVTARGGAGLTVARPIAEVRIPDPSGRGFHRLAAHLDVISRSPAMTIRKFPHVKLSLSRLVVYGTVSPLLAGYLTWLLLQRGFILIVGIMASGKTSLLQALISAMPITYKIITIEDTPELSTPAPNWHPLYVRRAPSGSELEDVTYSRLLQHSLRHRGTIVTLGEVRGAEFADLVQAAASGHGAACTFHATDPISVISRVTAPPINVAPENVKLINSIVHIAKTKTYVGGTPRSVRRVLNVYEIVNVTGRNVDYVTVFKWNPLTDQFTPPLTIEGLKQLWARSVAVKTKAYAIYGDEAPRALVEIYVLAKFIQRLASRGQYDIKTVLYNMTALYKEMDRIVSDLWIKKFKDAFSDLSLPH